MQQGTGLQGMADRIDALGGHVHIDSGPGQAPGSAAKYRHRHHLTRQPGKPGRSR
ncbi:MAG TPA: hypothetical protein VF933_23820 [Streptosporangiaceae bacterium]